MTINFPTRVFVYGTLKRGEPNANVISETEGKYRFIGVGRTKMPYPLVIGSKYNIPFVINEPGKGHLDSPMFVWGNATSQQQLALSVVDTLYRSLNIPPNGITTLSCGET
ncbi:hypothetical protein NECAME_18590 [Necator americanus]|uniref:Gamma-glutamylcyclotransferase family protein n=1 Tax=Necator americanus TaxID=51031 RepID=W2ST81_NECAM|nr:hypothetical protein NECAME_18590 [Necator americanus]ETN72959.1 hypothetical protein NECAME_18590 [Necator americanus]